MGVRRRSCPRKTLCTVSKSPRRLSKHAGPGRPSGSLSMHSTTTEAPAALLANLVAIDSVNPAYPGGRGEAALAEWVLARCRASGVAAELDEVLPGRPT